MPTKPKQKRFLPWLCLGFTSTFIKSVYISEKNPINFYLLEKT